jgi:hypothetical protein
MGEKEDPSADAVYQHREAMKVMAAYYRELDTRRNTLSEIVFMRMASWLIICGSLVIIPILLLGTWTLPYSIAIAAVCLLMVFLAEVYRNSRRPA